MSSFPVAERNRVTCLCPKLQLELAGCLPDAGVGWGWGLFGLLEGVAGGYEIRDQNSPSGHFNVLIASMVGRVGRKLGKWCWLGMAGQWSDVLVEVRPVCPVQGVFRDKASVVSGPMGCGGSPGYLTQHEMHSGAPVCRERPVPTLTHPGARGQSSGFHVETSSCKPSPSSRKACPRVDSRHPAGTTGGRACPLRTTDPHSAVHLML